MAEQHSKTMSASEKDKLHGDDYLSVGRDVDLKWIREEVETKFEIKTAVIGPEDHDQKEATILSRIVRFGHQGVGMRQTHDMPR